MAVTELLRTDCGQWPSGECATSEAQSDSMIVCAVDIFMYNRRGHQSWVEIHAGVPLRQTFVLCVYYQRRLATTAEACTANFSASKIN